MKSLTEKIAENRMSRRIEDTEVDLFGDGKIRESVHFGLGSTSITREMNPDGTRGSIRIVTDGKQEDGFGHVVSNAAYRFLDGELVSDRPRNGEVREKVGPFLKAKILSRLVLGRANHDMRDAFDKAEREDEDAL